MEGELTGRVALIPASRPGWEEADQPIPCLIGRFHTRRSCAYYDVDSPFMAVHNEQLLDSLGGCS